MSLARVACVALLVSGCGNVSTEKPDAATGPDAPLPAGTKLYRGSLAATQEFDFGGGEYCNYTITLRQIDLEIGINSSGTVIAGTSQALVVEGIAFTDPPCTFDPIPANVHKFTLASASVIGTGYALTFTGNTMNAPNTNLVLNLQASGASFVASATWHRTDQVPPLDWTASAVLSLQLVNSGS
ncbi:MAG: hypothetical protein R3B48_26265 [Kofleriaceae bacterium]